MLGAILGAVGSVASGILGNKSAEKANKAQAAARQEDIALQREFAQNSLQWKAADAEKAGISKQYAMGAPGTSYSPVGLGSTASNFGFLESAGQNVGRAMEAGQSNSQTAASRQGQALTLQGMSLDNDIKRAQLSSILRTQSQPGTPPGIPAPNTVSFIPGQGNGAQGETEVKTKIDSASASDPSQTSGTTPEVMLTRTNAGGYSPALPPALQEAYESMGVLPTWQWNGRNLIRPAVAPNSYAPKELTNSLKADEYLSFDPVFGEYHIRKKPRKPWGGGKHGG